MASSGQPIGAGAGEAPVQQKDLTGTWTTSFSDPNLGKVTNVVQLNGDGTLTFRQKHAFGERLMGTGWYTFADGVLVLNQTSTGVYEECQVEWLGTNQIRTTYLRGPAPAGTQVTWAREGAW